MGERGPDPRVPAPSKYQHPLRNPLHQTPHFPQRVSHDAGLESFRDPWRRRWSQVQSRTQTVWLRAEGPKESTVGQPVPPSPCSASSGALRSVRCTSPDRRPCLPGFKSYLYPFCSVIPSRVCDLAVAHTVPVCKVGSLWPPLPEASVRDPRVRTCRMPRTEPGTC